MIDENKEAISHLKSLGYSDELCKGKNLAQCGIDSLACLTIVLAFEQKYGAAVDDSEIVQLYSYDELVYILAKHIHTKL